MHTQPIASIRDRGSPADRSTEFVSVEGGGSSTTDAATVLVVAYVLMWLATVSFVLQTWRKMKRVQGKVEQLQQAMADRPASGPD
jgi:hypothetical protein